MTIRTPSPTQLIEVGHQLGMRLSEQDASEYLEAMAPLIASCNTVDGMADNLPPVKYPRTPGYRPEGRENPNNAW
jgi:amidase